MYGTAVPTELWPSSEDASILLCLLLVFFILLSLCCLMCPSGRRTPILFLVFPLVFYSIIQLNRTLVVRIANYPNRLGPSTKHFLTVTVLHLFMALIFPPFVKYI